VRPFGGGPQDLAASDERARPIGEDLGDVREPFDLQR
jgi:hypothetical protein